MCINSYKYINPKSCLFRYTEKRYFESSCWHDHNRNLTLFLPELQWGVSLESQEVSKFLASLSHGGSKTVFGHSRVSDPCPNGCESIHTFILWDTVKQYYHVQSSSSKPTQSSYKKSSQKPSHTVLSRFTAFCCPAFIAILTGLHVACAVTHLCL